MTTPDVTETPAFGEWAILELMGHRRVVGHVSEQIIAGRAFLRVDIPAAHGQAAVTQFYAPTAVYALHPSTEDIVRSAVMQMPPYQPLNRWELEASKTVDDDGRAQYLEKSHRHDDDDDEDGGPW